MPRPKKRRKINFDFETTHFKPRGVPLAKLDEMSLDMDEMEAIRLCDAKSLSQTKAAKKMDISQSTLGRILQSAHKKIAKALTEGNAIRVKEPKKED